MTRAFDAVLLANLSAVNKLVAAYVLACLDADAGRRPPPTVLEELQLAEDLAQAAQQLTHHARQATDPPHKQRSIPCSSP